MATSFSPCKGSYVLNQFPSNVMFGMNGFQPVELYRAIMALLLYYQFPHLHTGNTLQASNIPCDEDIENNYMFVMLGNLSGISHLIYQMLFIISGAKSKNTYEGT